MKHKVTETEKRVIRLVTPHVNVINEEVTYNSTFDDLGLDSIDRVELEIEVEKAFGIEFREGQTDGITTVGELIELIDNLTDGTL